jgi:hypothetical protein
MILGETDSYDSSILLPNVYLSPVAYPMEETYMGDDPEHEQTITITNDAELKEWADAYFGEDDWEIWDMPVPEGAIVEESAA